MSKWKLWYKVNTMIGVTILTYSVVIDNNNTILAFMLYSAFYGLLWTMNFIANK